LKFDYLNLGFWSLAEIVVVLLVLNACTPGFEVLVISSIALVYAQIMATMTEESFASLKLAGSFAIELTAVRRGIEELKRPDVEHPIYSLNDDPEVVNLEKQTRKAKVATSISQVKYVVIGLICIVEVLRTVL
jgi:hypothetical protein